MRTLLLVPLLLAACGAPDVHVRNFLGSDVVRILESAERVESLRIDGSLEARVSADAPVDPGEHVEDYPVTAHGPALDADQAARLRALLFDGGNWDFEIAKGCEFMPGVDFRFVHGAETVDVLLCFSCDEWGFVHGGSLRIEDSDAARGGLVRLARECFPGDTALAGLR